MRFRARTTWIAGTHCSSTFDGYLDGGPGGWTQHRHARTFTVDADQPATAGGRDTGLTPVEFLLHALAACLTAAIATGAADRRIRLTAAHAEVAGGVDGVTVRCTVHGEAPAGRLRAVVAEATARSAVHAVLSAAIPVQVETVIR